MPSWYCAAGRRALLCRPGERADLQQRHPSPGKASSTAGVISWQANPFPFSRSVSHNQTELSNRLHQQRRHVCRLVSTYNTLVCVNIRLSRHLSFLLTFYFLSRCRRVSAQEAVSTRVQKHHWQFSVPVSSWLQAFTQRQEL